MSLFLCLSGISLGDIAKKVLLKAGGMEKDKRRGVGHIERGGGRLFIEEWVRSILY